MLMRVPASALRTRTRPTAPAQTEVIESFRCFGGACRVIVLGDGPLGSAADAAAYARRTLLEWHDCFTRFDPTSELSRLNADRRTLVPASDVMLAFAEAARDAAELTGGLVDPTLAAEIVAAGYATDLDTPTLSLRQALTIAPARRPARPHPARRWRALATEPLANAVVRPPGTQLDGGGILKGLFADLLVAALHSHARVVVDCGGDLRLGGADPVARAVEISSPFDGDVVHELSVTRGAVATSGIGARRWLRFDGTPGHHLLDPSTGHPAFTGLIQVSALAPTAVRAEALAKAALLAGPAEFAAWLPYGGLAVCDDASVSVIEPSGRAR